LLNQGRIEEVHLELDRLQREKEIYEVCCDGFCKDLNENGGYVYSKKQDLDQQCEAVFQLKDDELLALLEESRKSFGEVERICGEGIGLVNEETGRYQWRYESQKEELLQALRRLEGGCYGW